MIDLSSWLSSVAELPTSLSHGRYLSVVGEMVVASVENGSHSSWSQGHGVFTRGPFALPSVPRN